MTDGDLPVSEKVVGGTNECRLGYLDSTHPMLMPDGAEPVMWRQMT